MGQLGAAQSIVDEPKSGLEKLKSFFGKGSAKQAAPAKPAYDPRVAEANESFRKRAEAEKAAAKKPVGKVTRKRSSGK